MVKYYNPKGSDIHNPYHRPAKEPTEREVIANLALRADMSNWELNDASEEKERNKKIKTKSDLSSQAETALLQIGKRITRGEDFSEHKRTLELIRWSAFKAGYTDLVSEIKNKYGNMIGNSSDSSSERRTEQHL